MASGGIAELDWVWRLSATDSDQLDLHQVSRVPEVSIKVLLAGGELHYASRVLYPSMVLLLSQIWKWDIGIESTWKHDTRRLLLSIMLTHDH